jgi:glycosyl transferase, family 25
MHICVISLRSAHARREAVRARMAYGDLSFRFFDAADGRSEPTVPVDRLKFRIISRRVPAPGEIGCYASHRAVWRHCAELGEPVLVLEDDFGLAPGFARALNAVEALTRQYGFIRLELLYRPPRRRSLRPRVPVHPICERDGLTLFYLADVPTSMIGYAISPSAAAALVEASTPIGAPVDRFVQRTWTHGVPVFGIEPALVGPSALAESSTIGLRTRSRNPLLLTLRAADSVWSQLRRRRFNAAQLRRLGLAHRPEIGLAHPPLDEFRSPSRASSRRPAP